MKREWDMKEVSDGKRYQSNDMVGIGCNDCEGCSSCCHDMGSSIVLDPYDVYRLEAHLKVSMEQMLTSCLELQVVDGIILPNLKMQPGQNHCLFLNEEGRCSIHVARPGICRLFPLGRIYEGEGFAYFHQIHECVRPGKTKVKISKWLETPNLKTYEQYIVTWHHFLLGLQEQVQQCADTEQIKQITMRMLQLFFIQPYDVERDFYAQFTQRLEQWTS